MQYARNAYDTHDVSYNKVPLLGVGGASLQLGIQPPRLFHQGSH